MLLRAPQPPTDANADRGDYFRSYLLGRTAVWTFVIGCGVGLVYGSYRQSALIMIGAPLAAILVILIASSVTADRAGALNFWTSFAASRGLVYLGRRELLPSTPLLEAGDDRWCEHWMRGKIRLDPPLQAATGYLVYQELEQRRDPGGMVRRRVQETRRVTICVVELEPAMAIFKGVFLRPRRGVFDHLRRDWLNGSRSPKVSLESSAFAERYELRIANDQDPLLVHQLFSPSLVNWLAGHPLMPGFELRADTLVVFVDHALEDVSQFSFLLDAAAYVMDRVAAEVDESAERPWLPRAEHGPPRAALERPSRPRRRPPPLSPGRRA